MKSSIALAALVAFNASLCCAEEIPGSQFGFGNWAGLGYTSDVTGDFSHCVVSASYVNGDTLFFSVNKQATVSVGVASPNLNMRIGEEFPVALYVDRKAPFFGKAIAVTADFAVLEIPDFERALNSFKKGYRLVVEGAGRRGDYDLSGTFRALTAATECAYNHYSVHLSPKNAAGSGSADIDKTILFQVSTEIIYELGLTGFRYFDSAELAKRGLLESSVFWEAPEMGVSGGTFVLPLDANSKLRDTDAADTQFVAGKCVGDFASSARDVSNKDTDVREIRVVCLEEGQQNETYLTKILIGDEVLYTLLTFSNNANSSGSEERRSQNELATLRVAKFILE